jgi:riboflavin kinase/FMN adenylyltransferase
MAAMAAGKFIARLTAAPVRTIAVGEDWRFGHNRAGDVNLLQNEAASRGYQLIAVPPVMFEGDRISSTRIRQAIHDGNLDEAARMLGRRYAVTGIVEKGEQLGRRLGFPTANVATGNLQLPPDGAWAVRAMDAAGRQWDGVANLGVRPTVGGAHRLLEVHLFGFSGEIYGENLEVCFEKHLRPEMKFPSLEALRAQISTDAQAARESLA